MSRDIGIRREDKNEWERRTPLIPAHVQELREKHDVDAWIQSSPIRAFGADEYKRAGATIVDSLAKCRVIFAIKEIPVEMLEGGKTYIFFSHTIKGQKDNMPMLQRLIDLRCQLLDYEKIVDAHGRRLVFFGNYAGMAGMIDTLWALGKRLAWEDMNSPFQLVSQTHSYATLDEARRAVQNAGSKISDEGLPQPLTPLICGFAGYGNVSQGAQQIYDLLPVREISPSELATFDEHDAYHVYKVVFREEDLVEPIADDDSFDLQDYYDYPEKYRARFESYVPYLTALINGIFWTNRYPRLVTRAFLNEFFDQAEQPRLRVIGDISCDVEGAIECNIQTTSPGEPIYVYDPASGQATLGYEGPGVVILAVDNLPAELPRESSTHFSATLMPFVPEIANADYEAPLAQAGFSPTIQRAVIVWQGQLTPRYRYLADFLP